MRLDDVEAGRVEGTTTIAPSRRTSRSVMLSAPATIPAMIPVTSTAALDPAGPGTLRCSVTSRCSPARTYRVPLFPRGPVPSHVPSSLATGALDCHDPPTPAAIQAEPSQVRSRRSAGR